MVRDGCGCITNKETYRNYSGTTMSFNETSALSNTARAVYKWSTPETRFELFEFHFVKIGINIIIFVSLFGS